MANCPFCGVNTDVPHETQEGCIQALHAEIARVRAVLGHVYTVTVRNPADDGDDEPGPDGGQT